MNIYDAAKFLGLTGDVTPELVKGAYKEAAKKYHPDINPAGAEMMKMVNAAFDVLKAYTGTFKEKAAAEDGQTEEDYPQAVNDALQAIINLEGLEIEICGAWVWVAGDTFTHKAKIKEAGFKYASKKKNWFFRPEDYKSRNNRKEHSMDDIRGKYGSSRPGWTGPKKIAGAA